MDLGLSLLSTCVQSSVQEGRVLIAGGLEQRPWTYWPAYSALRALSSLQVGRSTVYRWGVTKTKDCTVCLHIAVCWCKRLL